eukprot:m.106750 g.106750  ORF g.106750 m.106750 type:complete len:260 (+) comp16915_c0_seq1:345-1124(+)
MMDPTSCDQLDGCRGADAPADLRDDGDSNQSSGDDDDSGDGVYGGLVRALLRGKAAAADSVPRTVVQQIPGGGAAMPPAPSTVLSTLTTPSALAPTVPPTGMPSIPAGGARIATPQIARVADQLDSVVSAVEEIQNVQKARIMHETRVQRWYQQLRTVIPSFLRGAIMGTLLFTTYEEVQEKIADTVGEAVPASTVGYVCAGRGGDCHVDSGLGCFSNACPLSQQFLAVMTRFRCSHYLVPSCMECRYMTYNFANVVRL